MFSTFKFHFTMKDSSYHEIVTRIHLSTPQYWFCIQISGPRGPCHLCLHLATEITQMWLAVVAWRPWSMIDKLN